jgi:pimeloyl-ACP methyl ester carboxylesterase
MTSVELSVEHAGYTLAGTLHLPASTRPVPAVLMLQGSGAADRNSGDFFPPIRQAFLSRGLAVYSFDKPGIGESSGNWRHVALFDQATQAERVIGRVQEQPQIDARRVGLWGHSQGAWVTQIVASRRPELPFAIANSGPGISPRDQDLYGVEHMLREEGKSEADIARAIEFMQAIHVAAERQDDYATVSRNLLDAARGQPWASYLTFDEADDWGLALRFFAEAYTPVEALSRIRCPLLSVFGALDVLLPAHESAEIVSHALHAAGNPDVTIAIFPRGNHRMLVPGTKEFVAGYLDLLADWAARRVAQS